MIRLSICIATFRRAAYIGETLASIVDGLPPGVEVVVVDGASPDDTATVVEGFARRCPALRYHREVVNSGVDADFDKAVGYARGDYCWLTTDDDILLPGAIARVLAALDGETDLVVVDSEVRDVDLDRTLDRRRLRFSGERRYGANDTDRLLADTGDALSFIGSTVIRRATWLARDRPSYFGTLFIHVGVIFQAPLSALVIGEPLIAIRLGNAMWSARSFEIWMFKWPDLIWSLPAGDAAKAAVTPRAPWRRVAKLVALRANGAFGLDEARRMIAGRDAGPARLLVLAVAAIPGTWANVAAMLYLAMRGHRRGAGGYTLAHASRYANRFTRWLAT